MHNAYLRYLKDCKSTLKDTSRDSSTEPPFYMTDSDLSVVSFDRAKRHYTKERHLSGEPSSCDALYYSKAHDNYYFIEFKNGGINERALWGIKLKLCSSAFLCFLIKLARWCPT